jgi:DnaA family protein
MQQLPLRVRLRDYSRFDSFIAGDNAEACELLARSDADAPRVVWLWGRAGTGKTHLLQAACASAGERGSAAAYVDLAIASSAEVLDGCESLALVCLDAIDAVGADAHWSAAIFRLYTLLHDGTGRLVVASTTPPAAIPFVLPDLRSRLLAASVHQLVELEEPGQCAALQRRAAALGLELTEDAALYLVRRLPRDMHSLFEVLERLDHASLVAQRRLTIPFLREALDAPGSDQSGASDGADERVNRR